MFNNNFGKRIRTYLSAILIALLFSPVTAPVTSPAQAATAATWTSVNNGGFATGITYGNGMFVVVGAAQSGMPQIRTSNNGQQWSVRTPPVGTNGSFQWQSVAFGDGVFVAVGYEEPAAWDRRARVMRSVDGINWTLVTLPAAMVSSLGIVATVAYGNHTFAAAGRFGGMMYSTDMGLTWTQTTVPTRQFRSIAYGNGKFVAVGITGVGSRVLTSTDGITWTAQTSPEASWNSVTYGGGQFVAVAQDTTSQVMTSPDGITWTARNAAAAGFWSGVTYGNGLYVAVGGNNTANTTVMKSADAITWTLVSAYTGSFYNVAYGPDMFIAVRADNNAPQIMYTGTPSPTITAKSLSHVFGQSVNAVTAVTWLPTSATLDSTPAVVCGAFTDSGFTTPVTSATPPGIYYTNCTGPTATHVYAGFPSISGLPVVYQRGTYQVIKPTATITYPALTKVYGDTVPFLASDAASLSNAQTITTGLVLGDVLDSVTASSWIFSSSSQLATANVGASYTYRLNTGSTNFQPTSGSAASLSSRYSVVESPATGGVFTITKAPLTVTPAPITPIALGATVPTRFTPSYSGWKLGQSASTPPAGWGAPICIAPSVPVDASRNATTPGTYTVYCLGGAATNYSFTFVPSTLTVLPATPPNVTITSSNESSTVGSPIAAISYSVSGLAAGDWIPTDAQFDCVAADGSNNVLTSATKAGSYVTKCTGPAYTGLGNPIVYSTGTYTINKASLTIVALDRNKVYGDVAAAGTADNATVVGLVNGDTVSISYSYSPSSPLGATAGAGSYTITPAATLSSGTLTDYYNITTTPGTFTVAKAVLRIRADDGYAVTGQLVTGYTSTSLVTSTPPAGYNSILAAKYYGLKNADSAPATAPLCTWNLAAGVVGTVSPDIGKIVNPDSSATLTCAGAVSANYSFVYETAAFPIQPQGTWVKAGNGSSAYGSTLVSVSAYSINDVAGISADLHGVVCSAFTDLSATTALTSVMQPGVYPVICSGPASVVKSGTSTSYPILYQNGVYTITKPTLTIRPSNRTRIYGDAFAAGTSSNVTVSGLVNTDTDTVTVAFSYSAVQNSSTSVGNYAITSTATLSGGRTLTDYYSVVYETGTASVTPLKVQVIADNLTNVKFGSTPPASYTYTVKKLDGTSVSSSTIFSVAPTCVSGFNSNTPRGTIVDIVCSGGTLVSSNYAVEYIAGTLEVEPVPLTPTNVTPVYYRTDTSTATVAFTAASGGGNWIVGCKVSWALDPSAGTNSPYEALVSGALRGTSNNLVLNANIPVGVYNVTMTLGGNCGNTPTQRLLVVEPNTVVVDSRIIGSGSYVESRTASTVDFSFEWRKSGSTYTTPFSWTVANNWRINSTLGSEVTLTGMDGVSTTTVPTWGRNACPVGISGTCSTLIGQVMLQRWVPNWRLVSGGYWKDFAMVDTTFRVAQTTSGAHQVSMQMRQVPGERAIPARVPTSLWMELSSGSIQHL